MTNEQERFEQVSTDLVDNSLQVTANYCGVPVKMQMVENGSINHATKFNLQFDDVTIGINVLIGEVISITLPKNYRLHWEHR